MKGSIKTFEENKTKVHDLLKKYKNGLSKQKLFELNQINPDDDQQAKSVWQLNSVLVSLQRENHVERFQVGNSWWYKNKSE